VLDTLAHEETDISDDAAVTDPAALFAAAYRSFAGPVLGYLRARGVDDPEAVTQDVFMAFYPMVADLTGGLQGAKSLLFSIAHARLVDHYRRVERRPRLSPYDPQDDHRTTPSAEEQAVDLDGGASALLEGLSREHQEVLALRVVADLSIEQVAGIMGKSAGAIKQLQRRALQNLKAQTLAKQPLAKEALTKPTLTRNRANHE
jgi:RNA polymerase sigma-70 factor (ECF subfamily)